MTVTYYVHGVCGSIGQLLNYLLALGCEHPDFVFYSPFSKAKIIVVTDEVIYYMDRALHNTCVESSYYFEAAP